MHEKFLPHHNPNICLRLFCFEPTIRLTMERWKIYNFSFRLKRSTESPTTVWHDERVLHTPTFTIVWICSWIKMKFWSFASCAQHYCTFSTYHLDKQTCSVLEHKLITVSRVSDRCEISKTKDEIPSTHAVVAAEMKPENYSKTSKLFLFSILCGLCSGGDGGSSLWV